MFHISVLIAGNFMIISLFKNCTWLQQFHVSIESLMGYMFYERYFENKTYKWAYINNFKQLWHWRTLSFCFNYTYISLKQPYKTPPIKYLIKFTFFNNTNERLKLYIVFCILHFIITLIIYQTIHSLLNKVNQTSIHQISKMFLV